MEPPGTAEPIRLVLVDDHQMVLDLGLQWRAYDGGGVEPTSDQPRLSSVAHTGKHRIPILYEREVTAPAPPQQAMPV